MLTDTPWGGYGIREVMAVRPVNRRHRLHRLESCPCHIAAELRKCPVDSPIEGSQDGGGPVAVAERHGLRLAAGPRFGTGHAFDDRLRLPFTHPPEVLRRAVDRLADADAEATGVPTPTDRGRTAPVL